MSEVSDRVGLVGIGLLGQALARRLLGAGFEVAGFDVDPAKNAKLAELGGRPAASVADLAQRCDPIVLAVFSTDQVEEVVERELLPALGDGSGSIVLCASTCDPDRIAALGARVAARGLRFLETPVSGSSGQVSRGEGVGLIGGDPQRAAAAEPVLRALFPAISTSASAATAGAPSSPSTSSSASTVWRWPRAWCSPSALGSIPRRFSRWRARPPPTPRSWT